MATDSQRMNSSPGLFFIIGRPRSGTTMLRSLLDTHSAVIVPPEYPILLRTMRKFRQQNFQSTQQKQWLFDQLTSFKTHENKFYDTLGLNEDHLRDLIVQHQGTLSFQQGFQYFIQCCTSARLNGKAVLLGDKNPVYSFYFQTLMRKFPGVKCIFLIRDPREQFHSIKKFDFEMTNPFLQAARWKLVTKRMLKVNSKSPDNTLIVRYEDIAEHPELKLNEICQFLGVGFEPEMLNFYKLRPSHIDEKAGEQFLKFHTSLTSPVSNSRISLWKSELSHKEVKSIEYVAGNWMKKTGYDVITVGRNWTLWFPALIWKWYTFLMLGLMHSVFLLRPGYRAWILNFIYKLSKVSHKRKN
jgi:hypothetical protein